MQLGVLDLGGIDEAVQLAPHAEQLGYARYWIAEHQPQPSPTLIAALVAGQTDRIRVGTAGVLLHYHPLLRTAHDFHLLERAHVGRIDAGFCAGITARRELVEVEGVDAVIAAYPERAARFVAHLRNTRGAADFDASLAWPGVGDRPPEIWSLGGGARSAELAARLGLALGYALMFTSSVDDPGHAERYRERFVPHPDRQEPRVAVAVAGVCAETDAQARALAEAFGNPSLAARVVGSPATCRALLGELAARYRADELIFADLCRELPDRLRCYELLAEALL